MLSYEWNPYHYVKELGSAVKPKEKDEEKFRAVPEEGTLIKSTVGKATEITMLLKPSKMCRMFKWKFPMQLLEQN